MCLLLVLILMGSGGLMLFVYKPFPELAYRSVQILENQILFGRMIRGLHYFSANLLIGLVFCHMLRVFFTGGFKKTRGLNWIVGVCILILVLLSCFTGYLLPWDQTAFWAVTICMNMFDYMPAGLFLKNFLMSSNSVNEKTLHFFFTLHTTLIPTALILFLSTHFWKIRKAKGVVTSGTSRLLAGKKPVMVDTNPNLLMREAAAAMVLIAILVLLSFAFGAPLDDMANAGVSPNPAKAPWYFAGFQELLLHFHPIFAVFFIPGTLFCIMIYLPFKQGDFQNEGNWFISSKGKKAAATACLFSFVLTPGLILLDDTVLDFQKVFPDMPLIVSTGVIPFSMVLLLVILFHFGMKKKLALTSGEAFQTSVVLLITAFVILTLTCVWLRGKGMNLIFTGEG